VSSRKKARLHREVKPVDIGASIFFTEYSISPAALEERGSTRCGCVAEHSHIPVTRRR
jgi:hypothetical protein